MLIEIFTVLKNEESILPLYLSHYQNAFPGCIINIYDNNSEDRSRELCNKAGCTVRNFTKYSEHLLQDFKNNIWKSSQADWIIVCDADELADITLADLESLDEDINILKLTGYKTRLK